jgi:hypothetical protein
MTLDQLTNDFADSLVDIDCSGIPFKEFQNGVGPYGEPQMVRGVADRLRVNPVYGPRTATKRVPDLLIPEAWAVEVKIARPFGDNGREAEDWSVNLLHPYPGNTSVIGDCLKLEQWSGSERRAALVVGYEHTPPQIDLSPLFDSFEAIATSVIGLKIGPRVEVLRAGLCHPVHQQLRVVAWEVFPRVSVASAKQLAGKGPR